MRKLNEHSHVGPRQTGRVLNLGTAALDAGILEDLRRVGIVIHASIAQDMMEGLARQGYAYGQDAMTQGLTTPSMTTPLQFLQAWLPGFVRTITRARKIDELVGLTTVGSWEDEEVVQGAMELIGESVPYSDYGNVPLSSWNVSWERRSIVRFEEGLQVGRLEETRAARINVNSAEAKREAAAQALEIQRNAIGFYGYNSGVGRTYGLLNDPNLPAYVTVAVGASASTHWSTKTYLEIIADLREAFIALRVNSGDTIDPAEVETTLALPTNTIDYLSVQNTLGTQSVRQWLRETYPKCRPISSPEFNNAQGGENIFYLYAETVDDGSSDDNRTITQIVPTKFMALGVEQRSKSYVEDFTNATAGILVKRPYAVIRRSGI